MSRVTTNQEWRKIQKETYKEKKVSLNVKAAQSRFPYTGLLCSSTPPSPMHLVEETSAGDVFQMIDTEGVRDSVLTCMSSGTRSASWNTRFICSLTHTP